MDAPSASTHPRRRPLSDRRGVAGVSFVLGAGVLLGMAALATEGGVWYLARRNAQSAADAAAYAGATALSFSGDTAAVAAGREVAGRNGFADDARSSVSVTPLPWGGGATNTAVRVRIQQTQRIGLARLFTGTPPVAAAEATAALRPGAGGACTLSLSGAQRSTNITGNSLATGSDCVIASNALGSESIRVAGSSTVDVFGLRTTGQCSGCTPGGGNVSARTLVSEFQPKVANPYRYLDSKSMPPSLTCVAPTSTRSGGGTHHTIAAWTATQPRATCSDLKLNNRDVLTLAPGVYYFAGASLGVSGGSVTCSGCAAGGAGVTLVFVPRTMGGAVGNLDLSGGGVVRLMAPTTCVSQTSCDTDYQGVVVYRRGTDPNDSSSGNTLKINGNSDSYLAGTVYAPTSQVQYNGTMDMNHACTMLIANTITFTGNSTVTLDRCTEYGAPTPSITTLSLVQ